MTPEEYQNMNIGAYSKIMDFEFYDLIKASKVYSMINRVFSPNNIKKVVIERISNDPSYASMPKKLEDIDLFTMEDCRNAMEEILSSLFYDVQRHLADDLLYEILEKEGYRKFLEEEGHLKNEK